MVDWAGRIESVERIESSSGMHTCIITLCFMGLNGRAAEGVEYQGHSKANPIGVRSRLVEVPTASYECAVTKARSRSTGIMGVVVVAPRTTSSRGHGGG